MKMVISSRLWTLGVPLLATAMSTVPAGAQVSAPVGPSGNYVFSEAGPAFTSLAQLSFGAGGSVWGTEVLRAAGAVSWYVVQGTYSVTDQSVNITLNATGLDAVDADGDPLTFVEGVELIGTSTGEFASIRTDAGMYATGSLVPSGSAPTKGTYVLNGRTIDPAAVSVEVVTLDGTGAVSGRGLLDSFGAVNMLSLSGSYASQPNGFQILTLTGRVTGPDGNTVASTETYVMLTTRKDIRLIRADSGPAGIFTLTQ